MEYQDFTIEIRSAAPEGCFEALVVDPPGASAEALPFPRPFDETALKKLLTTLDIRADPPKRSTTPAPDLCAWGHDLYRSVFHGKLAESFEKSRREALARTDGAGLRLRLRFDFKDPASGYLAALPWELLRDGEFLSKSLSVVRDVAGSTPRKTLALDGPPRILVVGAAIPGTPAEAAVKRETDRIVKVWRSLAEAGQAELRGLKVVSLDNLRETLRRRTEPVHILHFVGHGAYNAETENGSVVLVHPDGGENKINAETLADHLKSVPELRLVVLNSCQTARHAGRARAPFNFGVAAAILERTSVQAVVAQQYTISFDAALRFSEIFYGCLAAGDEIDTAMTETRLRLESQSEEWSTPVLFLAAKDGKLFNFPPGRAPHSEILPRPSDEPVRLGVRSRIGWGKDMDDRNDKVLDLVEYFNDRYIKDEQSWMKEIFPRLELFLNTNAEERRPLALDFAAHASIAFAAGWVLEAKSGLDVSVRQRINQAGEREWHPRDHDERPVPKGPLWLDEPDVELAPGGPDVAVALAVSQPKVAEQVEDYLRRHNELPVGRLLRATIATGPGQQSVAGGAHCLLLAQALVERIRERRPHERSGTCHLFCAAPNALVFYLGQLSRSFGRIVLYEHPYGTKDAYGRYKPAIELVMPGPPDLSGW